MADNAPENVKAFNLDEFINDSNEHYDGEVEENSTDDIEDQTTDDKSSDQPNEDDQESRNAEDAQEDDYINEVTLLETEMPDNFTQNEVFMEDALNLDSIDWTTSSFIRLGCIAHGLQLVIKDTINSSSVAKKIVERVMAVITFFNNSNYWNSKLVLKTKLSVVAPGATRWNGIIFAMERLLKVCMHVKLEATCMELTQD